MRKLITLSAVVALLNSPLSHAEQILSAQSDTLVGGGYSSLSGFMLGGAAGGPVGAVVGAAIGYFAGSEAQQALGLEQTLYVIKDDGGHVHRVRSSDAGFIKGQQVSVQGSQITALAP